ncbi:type I restriction enzyme, S subunit [Ruminococcus sp. YRD2003]|uniref:restriction endonuclease subunit S n=1 Tax=Ruminococcus sp. YRD2003 TaxID=1452313 RepID=UPI0008D7E45C|nr:type I restriction enzyme, S subunit [Ruminococcus flavefaciens]
MKLKECCNFIDYRGKTPEKSDEGYRFITAKNIGIDGYHDEPKEYIPRENYEKVMVRGIPNENDILFTTEAPLGHVGLIPHFDEPFAIGQRLIVIQPKKELLNSEYLLFLLRSHNFQNEVIKHSSGSTVTGIRSKELVEIDISFPDLETQRKIASNLDKVTHTIDLCNAILEKLDMLVKARFVEMFGEPLTNPMNWNMKRLDEVAVLNKGITYAPEEVSDEGIIVLRSSNIKGNAFDLEDIVKIAKKVNPDKYVQTNDILMCNRNGSARLVGKVAKIPELSENMTFGTFMTIVRSDIYEYLFVFFQLEAFREQIKFQTAVAINQISLPLLASVKVPLPPKELTDKFAAFVEQTDKSKSAVKQLLEKAEALKKALMQEYFG